MKNMVENKTMNVQQLCSEDSEGRKKKCKHTCKCQYIKKTCNVIKTIYNLLLNATPIPMYNAAFIKNT